MNSAMVKLIIDAHRIETGIACVSRFLKELAHKAFKHFPESIFKVLVDVKHQLGKDYLNGCWHKGISRKEVKFFHIVLMSNGQINLVNRNHPLFGVFISLLAGIAYAVEVFWRPVLRSEKNL